MNSSLFPVETPNPLRLGAQNFTLLQPQLVRELGSIIRNQIPAGRKSVLDAYGDVLFRAWRDCEGACLLEVETLVQVAVKIVSLHRCKSCHLYPVLDYAFGEAPFSSEAKSHIFSIGIGGLLPSITLLLYNAAHAFLVIG